MAYTAKDYSKLIGMRADYIETFFKNINWNAAEARLK